jgi:hypothetical protein
MPDHLSGGGAEQFLESKGGKMLASEHYFTLEDLDRRLLSPKLNDLAKEMQKRIAESERETHFDTQKSGNSAGYLPRLFAAHEKLTEEWAKRLYEAYCEALNEQCESVSPEFIRAVRDQPIAAFIAARKASVQAAVRLRGIRIREEPNSIALGEWNRKMDRLATRWNGKLEAEAVAVEYRSAKDQGATIEHDAMAHSGYDEERANVTRPSQKARSGRPPRLPSDFVELAGRLWLDAKRKDRQITSGGAS